MKDKSELKEIGSWFILDTNNINFCFQLGDTLVIDATNNQVATQLDNDFELGTIGNGWQTGLSANVVQNDPTHCAWPPPANPVPNTAYVWMGNAAAHPRTLESVDFDLSDTEKIRRRWPFFRDRRIDTYKPLLNRYIED